MKRLHIILLLFIYPLFNFSQNNLVTGRLFYYCGSLYNSSFHVQCDYIDCIYFNDSIAKEFWFTDSETLFSTPYFDSLKPVKTIILSVTELKNFNRWPNIKVSHYKYMVNGNSKDIYIRLNPKDSIAKGDSLSYNYVISNKKLESVITYYYDYDGKTEKEIFIQATNDRFNFIWKYQEMRKRKLQKILKYLNKA